MERVQMCINGTPIFEVEVDKKAIVSLHFLPPRIKIDLGMVTPPNIKIINKNKRRQKAAR